MEHLVQPSRYFLFPCVSCEHFFIHDSTILGHLSSILHIVESEASMPQVLRISLMLIVLFDVVCRIVLFPRSFNFPSHPLLFFVPYSSWLRREFIIAFPERLTTSAICFTV
uniref:C2H2-type domain-containing protein n=1 Tax=Heterorhabditis bacteriophora TaxID=37862 RepID=A0A1I7WIR1_HETBA